MKIGCPKEIKPQEFRVGMTPNAAFEAVTNGHQVIIEAGAGIGAGFDDAAYVEAGAAIIATAAEIFSTADMIVKVKEPQAAERKMLREGQILFTYLHLAPDPDQTKDLLASGATCIAYETVTDRSGGLPLLAPAKSQRWSRGSDGWCARCWPSTRHGNRRRRSGYTRSTNCRRHGCRCDRT